MTSRSGAACKYYDMPRVRAIVRDAAKQDYRLSAIVLGIVDERRVPDGRSADAERGRAEDARWPRDELRVNDEED